MKGHIRKQGKNSYRIWLYRGRDPITGKDRYDTCTVHGTKKDAEAKLAELLHQVNSGEYVSPSKLTVGEYLDKWLRHIKPTVRPSTYHWYEDIVRLHLKPNLGGIPLAKLMPLHLQDYYFKAQSSGRLDSSGNPTGDKLSSASVRAHHRTIHRALAQAVKWGLIPRNVADLADSPSVVKTEKPTLTFEQGRQLLEAAKPTERYALSLMALTTGMREGEILGLRWKDVDLEAKTLTVRQALK